MNVCEKHYAVVGGGSTGPLQLYAIAKAAQENGLRLDGTCFHLIDPKGFGNGGIAYGQCSPNSKLNSDPNEMDPHDRGAHLTFRSEKGLSVDPQEFNARAEFLPVIQEQILPQAISLLRKLGADIVEYNVAAEPVINPDGSFDLIDTNTREALAAELTNLSSDDFVLCTGYGGNNNFQQLWDKDGYVHSLYADGHTPISERHDFLKASGLNIAVVGAGPALYDFANDLPAGHANVTVFSRHGKRLGTRDTSIEANETSVPSAQIAKPLTLKDLNLASSLDDAARALSREWKHRRQTLGQSSRRAALDINASSKAILTALSVDVAKDFRASCAFSRISHLATPVPESSQTHLDTLAPQFVAARLNGNISVNDNGGFDVAVGDQTHHFDAIINATGHCPFSSTLENLLKSSVVEIDERTGRIHTDESGYKDAKSGLAIIGPSTHVGTHGIESFYPYCEKEAVRFVYQALEQKGLQPATFTPITPPQPPIHKVA